MTLSSYLSKLLGIERSNIPNGFTLEMGKKVSKARTEAGLSQAELGSLAYFHQATISQIENGKREVTTSELIALSHALAKPLLYFFPDQIQKHYDKYNPLVEELTAVATKLHRQDLERLIVQAKALIE